MRTLILALFLALAAPVALAFAADNGVKPAALTAQDHADLARIETYLNEMHTISADFMQIDDNGGILRGTIEIQRPGKMRVDYAAPNKDFIIADGSSVHIWNDELKEQTNVDEGSSLAEFILRDPVKLNGDVTVTSFKHFPAKLEVTLVQTSDPAAGQLTLIFEDHPLQLRQWRVFDPQGHTTGVNLENVREGVTLPPNLFHYVPPNFGVNNKTAAP
jgi:outer membrane lipoprotein-sorting protein